MKEMVIQYITLALMMLAAFLNALMVFATCREALAKRRLRRQRLFIYAQFAEKFIEWGGLVPPSAGKDDDKPKIIRRRIAYDAGGVFEPDVDLLARSEDLWKRWRDLDAMARKVDLPDASGNRLNANNPFRPLAYVLTDDGYIGPFPLSWVKGIRCLDRKAKPLLAKVEILPNSDSSEDGGKDARDKR